MRRALLAIPAVLAVAGCGAEPEPIPPATPAPAQEAELAWEEPFPEAAPRLVFRVETFAVTEDGWEAEIAIANETDIAWRIGDQDQVAGRQFGVMLFATSGLDEVEERNRAGTLPAIRRATEYDPPPPSKLAAGETWSGRISAPGALAAGRVVRITFGLLVPDGSPPAGVPEQVLWITDASYELKGA